MTPLLGVSLPQFTGDRDAFIEGVQRAEAAGLDSIWLFDHLWPLSGGKQRPVLECWTALAWIAEATERVTVGTLVTRTSLRTPALLARMAQSVSSIAPGRLIVAIGSGDEMSRDENESFGMPFFDDDERADQFAAVVEVVRSALHAETVDHRDALVHVGGLAPMSAGSPAPVWVAGRVPAVFQLAGEKADGWNAWGGTPVAYARDLEEVRAAAGDRQVTPTWAGQTIVAATDEEARDLLGTRKPGSFLLGGPETIAARLNEFAAAGAEHIILSSPEAARPATFELLGTEVKQLLGEF